MAPNDKQPLTDVAKQRVSGPELSGVIWCGLIARDLFLSESDKIGKHRTDLKNGWVTKSNMIMPKMKKNSGTK
jgi:hypothetical protein